MKSLKILKTRLQLYEIILLILIVLMIPLMIMNLLMKTRSYKTSAESGKSKMVLSSSNLSPQVNQSFTVDLILNTNDHQIEAYDDQADNNVIQH